MQLSDPLTHQVIGLAIEVHRELGPGLLESVYQQCLAYELSRAGVVYLQQQPLPVIYKQVSLECGYRIDFIIESALVLEVKTVEALMPLHEAQLLTYLKLTGLERGLLLNFNVPVLKDGIKRMILTHGRGKT